MLIHSIILSGVFTEIYRSSNINQHLLMALDSISQSCETLLICKTSAYKISKSIMTQIELRKSTANLNWWKPMDLRTLTSTQRMWLKFSYPKETICGNAMRKTFQKLILSYLHFPPHLEHSTFLLTDKCFANV